MRSQIVTSNTKKEQNAAPAVIERIENKIYIIRGQRVMLDSDLAEVSQVETRVLNQAVHRNLSRFPKNFVFQLSKEEFGFLTSQTVTSKTGRGGRRKLPFVFTNMEEILG